MATRTLDERIKDLQTKQAQLKAQERALKAKQAQADRKARTKRLIEIGGAVESVLKKAIGEEGEIQQEDIPALIAFLQNQEDRGNYFSNAIKKAREKKEPEDVENFGSRLS